MSISLASAQQFMLVLIRVLGIIMLMPVFSSRFPAQVKIGLGIAISLLLNSVLPLPDTVLSALQLAGAAVREALLGFMSGFATRITFAGLEMGAAQIGLNSGLSMSTQLGSNMGDVFYSGGTPLEQLYMLFLGLVFLLADAHHLVLMGLNRTLELVPPGGFALSPLAPERFMLLVQMMFTTAVYVALPIMGTALLVDIALGILARAVPQIQVFFVGAPLKIGVSIAVLAIILPRMVSYMADKLSHIGEEMLIFIAR